MKRRYGFLGLAVLALLLLHPQLAGGARAPGAHQPNALGQPPPVTAEHSHRHFTSPAIATTAAPASNTDARQLARSAGRDESAARQRGQRQRAAAGRAARQSGGDRAQWLSEGEACFGCRGATPWHSSSWRRKSEQLTLAEAADGPQPAAG